MCEHVSKKIVTGVYGGSFNPIHVGHTTMASELLRRGCVEELWLVVSPQNPLKDSGLWDDNLRMRLARIAVEDLPGIEVSDVEFSLPKPNYMLITLQTLSAQHPDREFVLIIGMDNWDCFQRWYKWEEIIANYRLIVLPRESDANIQNLSASSYANVEFVPLPLINMSSTWIRNQIENNPLYDGEGLETKVWQRLKVERLMFNDLTIHP